MVIGIATPERTGLAERVCRGCGGILDAPRPEPLTGAPARKCAGCLVYYPCGPHRVGGRPPLEWNREAVGAVGGPGRSALME